MSTEGDTNENSPPRTGFQPAINHMLEKKIDALLWLTRLGTMVFTFLSMVPILGNPNVSYQRALLSSAATSALRLHQRLPRVQFSREFAAMLLREDSCHYLLYSILFILSYPITLALLPIFLFAFLHSVTYTLLIHEKLGLQNSFLLSLLRPFIREHQQSVLKLAAFTEVFILPFTVLLIFSGKGSLLAPFAYYRFLTLRYMSQRNPYTRNVFHEMKLVLEAFANKPGRSLFLKNLCYKVIYYTSYFAPQIVMQQ